MHVKCILLLIIPTWCASLDFMTRNVWDSFTCAEPCSHAFKISYHTHTHKKRARVLSVGIWISLFRLKGMLMLLCRITEMQHIFSIKKFVWAHEICVARQFYRKVHIYSKQHHLHAAQKKHQHQGKIRARRSVGDCIVLLWCWMGKEKTLMFKKKPAQLKQTICANAIRESVHTNTGRWRETAFNAFSHCTWTWKWERRKEREKGSERENARACGMYKWLVVLGGRKQFM